MRATTSSSGTPAPKPHSNPTTDVMQEASVLLAITEKELKSKTNCDVVARNLFNEGVFETVSDAQYFVGLLAQRASGLKLAVDMENYLIEALGLLKVARAAAAKRAAAFQAQQRLDETKTQLERLQSQLGRERSNLDGLRSHLTEFEAAYIPGQSVGYISQLAGFGKHVVGIKEAIRLCDAAIPKLEAEIKQFEKDNAVLLGS